MEMPESITKGLEAVDYTLCRIAEEVLHTTDMSAAGSLTVGVLMPMIEFRRRHVEAMDFLNYRAHEEDSLEAEPMSMGKPGSGGVSEMENAMGHTNS